MMRFIGLIVTLLFFCEPGLAQDWTGISDCGRYTISGVARSTSNGLVIVVNENSKSEIVVHVPILNEPNLAPYVDRAMTATVLIPKAAQGASVEGIVETIKQRLPNPLNPQDTGVQLTENTECDANAFDRYGNTQLLPHQESLNTVPEH